MMIFSLIRFEFVDFTIFCDEQPTAILNVNPFSTDFADGADKKLKKSANHLTHIKNC